MRKYDKDGNQIYQDIDYVVAANQTLTVNTEASNVFDHGLSRDVDELIDAVQRSLDARTESDRFKCHEENAGIFFG